MLKWIDISIPIAHRMVSWSSDPCVTITPHKTIGKNAHSNVSYVCMGSHAGTHLDVPKHLLKKSHTTDAMRPQLMNGRARVITIKDPVAVHAHE